MEVGVCPATDQGDGGYPGFIKWDVIPPREITIYVDPITHRSLVGCLQGQTGVQPCHPDRQISVTRSEMVKVDHGNCLAQG